MVTMDKSLKRLCLFLGFLLTLSPSSPRMIGHGSELSFWDRVVHGPTWKGGNQDGNPPGLGRVVLPEVLGWILVKWDNAGFSWYRNENGTEVAKYEIQDIDRSLMISDANSTAITKSGLSGFESYEAAKYYTNQLKDHYGNGISTRIIVHNNLQKKLVSPASLWKSYSGRFYADPPPTIAPSEFAAFLHVHSDSTWRGSVGYAGFTGEVGKTVAYIGWSTPYVGTNYVGCYNGNSPSDGTLYEMTCATRTTTICKRHPRGREDNTEMTATLEEDNSSTLVFFVISPYDE